MLYRQNIQWQEYTRLCDKENISKERKSSTNFRKEEKTGDLEWNDVHSEPIRGWLVPYVDQVCGIYLSLSFVVLHLFPRKPNSIDLLSQICER